MTPSTDRPPTVDPVAGAATVAEATTARAPVPDQRPAAEPGGATAPEPVGTGGRPPGRRPVALVLVALLGLLAGGVVAWRVLGPDEPVPPPVSIPVDGWPAAGESRTVTEVLAGGDLEVTHWIHADRPLDEVVLAVPELGDGEDVEVGEVEVLADGRPASVPSPVVPTGAAYSFDDATRVRVRYRLSGAVERSSSAEGRGLVVTTSLRVTPTQPRDVRVVRSEEVLSLACAAADEQPVPCGASGGVGQWRVDLPPDDSVDRVVAVVTVPS